MNLQNLEYTRIEVRRALLDLSGATKGQLEAFIENPQQIRLRIRGAPPILSSWMAALVAVRQWLKP